MNNKKGFIATTLIYSFFLVFIAVILAFIAMAIHNKNLISKANDSIRKDLQEKRLGNRDVGSYVRYKITADGIETNDIDWIIFNSDSNKTELVSSGILFTHTDIDYIKQIVNSLSDDCYVESARLLTSYDVFTVIEHNVDTIKQLQALLNLDVKGASDTTARANYLVMDNGEPKRYTYKEPSSNSVSSDLQAYKDKAFLRSNLTDYTEGARINVRLVITLSANTLITGGDGSYANPYNISTDKCYTESYLLNKILIKGYDNQDNYTTPGLEPSTNDEGLRTAPDDYGTSYYFRGSVENNYVVFAGMCWRIVRIDGKGNIKIILQTNTLVNGEVDCSYDAEGVNLMKSGSATGFAYNGIAMDNTYVGLMYGSEDQTTYDATHQMNNNSSVLSSLQSWYNSKFTSYAKKKLADVVWCNDLKCYQGNTYTCIGKEQSHYEAERRATSANPTFKCQNIDSSSTLGKYSSSTSVGGNGKLNGYKIGMITVDEALYAGSIYTTEPYFTIDTYLKKGSSLSYWTLSPWSYNPSSGAYMMVISRDAVVENKVVNDSTIGVRPMVALRPDVKVHGNGTARNPYVVE